MPPKTKSNGAPSKSKPALRGTFKTDDDLREAAQRYAAADLRASAGLGIEDVRRARGQLRATFTVSLKTDTPTIERFPELDPMEARIRTTLLELDKVLADLEAAAASRGTGRRAVWARRNAARIAQQIRSLAIPWEADLSNPPRPGGDTIVATLVVASDVDRLFDLWDARLQRKRPLTDRELGCIAVLDGYLPDAGEAAALNEEDVVTAARKAVHKARMGVAPKRDT